MKREDLFDVIGTAADTELLERSEQFEKSRNRGVERSGRLPLFSSSGGEQFALGEPCPRDGGDAFYIRTGRRLFPGSGRTVLLGAGKLYPGSGTAAGKRARAACHPHASARGWDGRAAHAGGPLWTDGGHGV